MPSGWWVWTAYSRHCSATGQAAQIALASPAKVSETGKKTLVSVPLQAASAKKSASGDAGVPDMTFRNAARGSVIPGLVTLAV